MKGDIAVLARNVGNDVGQVEVILELRDVEDEVLRSDREWDGIKYALSD